MLMFWYLIGYLIIYVACDVSRKEESKNIFGTKEWFIQVGLVTLGGIILTQAAIYFA